MPPFTIREATTDDAPALVSMFGALDDLHSTGAPFLYRGTSKEPRSTELLAELTARPDAATLLAVQDGRIVGMIWVAVLLVPENPTPLRPRRHGQVYDLYVEPDVRRTGLARALMTAAERWVAAQGVDSLELNVAGFNTTALRLYEALGYDVITRRMRKQL